MNETKEFINWEKDNKGTLHGQYADYLKETVLDDENFDIEATEDYWTWCEVEFDRLKEEENEK